MGTWKNKLWTLLIGLLAGAAPFLCMSYMPHLLDPASAVRDPDLLALAVVSVLVALVTMVQHSRKFEHENPAEILMRSLAIPSILLATVTGLQAAQSVSQQRATQSAIVDSTGMDVPIVPATGPLQDVTKAPGASAMNWPWAPGEAWAQPAPGAQAAPRAAVAPATAPPAHYLVTLGTYPSAEEADRAAKNWLRRRALGTERYYQKAVRVFRVDDRTFYVSYTTPLPRAEAVRLYKLLRINDPGVTPQVVQLAAAPR